MKQYEKYEINAEKAIFTSPSGKVYERSCFEEQEIELSYDRHGFESVRAIGEPKTTVRFFFDEAGEWQICADGKLSSITIEPASGGYVRPDRRDPRYFALSDGTPYFPLGINLAFIYPVAESDGKEFGQAGRKWLGLRHYERWFQKCRAGGVSLVRIWLGHEYLCPDTSEAGELDLVQLAKLDKLLELARKYDIRLKITIEQFRGFDYERVAESNSMSDDVFRKFNKKLWLNGKRCENVTEWLTEEKWKKAFKKKLSELAKRLSGDPAVFGIELWNEMNCMPRYPMCDWNREMLAETKRLFPKQLVMNSLGSYDAEKPKEVYEMFPWDKSDVKQMHRYLDGGAPFEICRHDPIALIADGIKALKDDTKPFLVAETGAVNDCHSGPFRYYVADDEGMIFCDTVYTPLFCSAASCGHIWHWGDAYVEAKGHFKLFLPLKWLIDGIDFAAEGFVPEFYRDEKVTLLSLRGKTVTLAYLRNNDCNWKKTLRDLQAPEKIDFTLPFDGNIEMIPIDESAELSGKTVKALYFGALIKVKNQMGI